MTLNIIAAGSQTFTRCRSLNKDHAKVYYMRRRVFDANAIRFVVAMFASNAAGAIAADDYLYGRFLVVNWPLIPMSIGLYFIWFHDEHRRELLEIKGAIVNGRLSQAESFNKAPSRFFHAMTAGLRWRPVRAIDASGIFEPVLISMPSNPKHIICGVLSLLVVIALLLRVFIWHSASGYPLVVMLGGLALFPLLRAFVFHPIRMFGRWAIVADPEHIEIPNWIRGSRVFHWHESTLAVVGAFGMTARVCVIEQDSQRKTFFNMPRSQLKTLLGVAVATESSNMGARPPLSSSR